MLRFMIQVVAEKKSNLIAQRYNSVPIERCAPTEVGFLYRVRLRIVSIRSRAHLSRVGHSEQDTRLYGVRPFGVGQPAIREDVYVTIVHPVFCLFLYLTSVHVLWKFIREYSSILFIVRYKGKQLYRSCQRNVSSTCTVFR